jgi:hypothetical protein
MTDIYLRRIPNGFIPTTEQEVDKLKRIKIGSVVKVTLKRTRNYKFLQKTMVLFQTAYEHFCEHGVPEVHYKGERVLPSFDRFRKDLTILSGHYTATINIKGEVRLEAKSLSYGECTEEEAEQIFSDVLNAAIKSVYKYTKREEDLRDIVERLSQFDGNWQG